MKRTIILILTAFIIAHSASAQINWQDYSHSFSNDIRKSPDAIGLILAIRKENNAFWEMHGRSKFVDSLSKDSSFRMHRLHEWIARTAFDTANAQFFLHGVGKKNAQDYQFRIIEFPGNQVRVPWKSPSVFADSTLSRQSGFAAMTYLGGFRAKYGSTLIMDVREAGSQKIISSSMVSWERVKPVITNIYTSETIDEFLRKMQSPWLPDKHSTGSIWPVLITSSANENIIFTLENGAFTRDQIQYRLLRNGQTYKEWHPNEYDNAFVWIKNCPPGDYMVQIRYSAQPEQITEYPFKVKPLWYETIFFYIGAGLVAIILSFLLINYLRQRRKIRQHVVDQSILQLELKAIYSQLNPHFIFNALSSIQSLINKQDVKGANIYLSDFARLTRNYLVNSQKNEIAIHEELETLKIYLRLEKLRFGFNYEVTSDPDINTFETNIPAMLLQPLVENAVKHGVASMGENGSIQLNIGRNGATMLATLADNGKGFQEDSPISGLGLNLTKNRIELLNKLRPETPIMFKAENNSPSGTKISVTFDKWFA